MGIYTAGNGPHRGKKRFIFETDSERDVLENARRFFHTSYLFLKEGLALI